METIKLVEQLEHRALHLAVAGLLGVEAFGADGVQLVDEDDGGRLLLREREGVAHELRAVTDEHLHELWPSQLQERRFGLRSTCTGHQRLPGTRRSEEKNAYHREMKTLYCDQKEN